MLDDESLQAFEQSSLRELPRELLEDIASGSMKLDIPAGSVTRRDGEGRWADLVIAGVVRSFLTSASGRQVTIRYTRSGGLLGAPSLFGSDRAPVSNQAITASRLLVLRPEILRDLALSDSRVGGALLALIAELANRTTWIVARTTFGSLRQRVVRQLLDIAAEEQEGERLAARISQQELADAAGTVREVLVRILRELREEGLIETGRDGIVIIDPVRLEAEDSLGSW
jgi:CRP/FNR family cyclic AMP-dependent transcriptional regulator